MRVGTLPNGGQYVELEEGDCLEGCEDCEGSAVLWFAMHGEHAPSKGAARRGNHFHVPGARRRIQE